MHQPTNLSKAGALALVFVIIFILCWEFYWRNRGFHPTINDDKIYWATKRKEIYRPADQSTVFIGPSRIKFDLDIPTWEKLTGEKPVQLAIVGTSCRLILKDLADDLQFKGKLLVDATEFSLFSGMSRRETSAIEALDYYHEETPSQKISATINNGIESQLVFVEAGKFGLNSLLNELDIPNRKKVFSRPPFPKEFAVTDFNRQSFITPMFLAQKELQQKQINNWRRMGAFDKKPGLKWDSLVSVFDQIKKSIDKIRSRGGQVVFIRPPSSGEYLETERIVYPRNQYWDKLLVYTNTPGIHFEDYESTAHFVCPEWSHLAKQDAELYTQNLIQILEKEKGWNFPNKPPLK
jgi:hypothetical protein